MSRTCDPDRHHRPLDCAQGRRSIRLPCHDYTRPGPYFVTICVRDRECLLGEIVDGEMAWSSFGRIVAEEWLRTAVVRPYVRLDEFIVMPNHVHGILCIVADDAGVQTVGAQRHGGATDAPAGSTPMFPHVQSRSLGAIVRSIKSQTTRRINQARGTPGAPAWQRNYYEHIIRDQEALNRIRDYIVANPCRWDQDLQNPRRQGQDDFDRWLGSYGAAF